MSNEANREALYRELDGLRREGRIPRPVEIARIAIKSGMTLRDAVGAVREFDQWHRQPATELAEAYSRSGHTGSNKPH